MRDLKRRLRPPKADRHDDSDEQVNATPKARVSKGPLSPLQPLVSTLSSTLIGEAHQARRVRQPRVGLEMLTDMTPAAAGQLYPQLQSIAKSPVHGHVVSSIFPTRGAHHRVLCVCVYLSFCRRSVSRLPDTEVYAATGMLLGATSVKPRFAMKEADYGST